MQFINSNAKMFRWLSLCVLALAAGGCAGADKGSDLSERFSWLNREPKPQQPGSIVLVWTDTVLNTVGQVPVRGFGGRVMFFDQPGGDQVVVSGKLIIYAYDESDGGAVTNVPDRKFVFTSQQLSELYGETDLGHSYSVWIPWDNVGGERRQISLLARFESDNGAVTISDLSRQLLPGIAPETIATHDDRQHEPGASRPGASRQKAVQASYDDSGRGAGQPAISRSVITRGERHTRRRMTVDTIDLANPLRQLMPHRVATGTPAAMDGRTQLGTPAAVAVGQPGVSPLQNNQPLGMTRQFAPSQQLGATQHPGVTLAGGNLASRPPLSAYAQYASPLPSVWERAQHRAQQASQATVYRQRPQAHSARPRPSVQAARFARQAPGRDWSQPSLPTQPSAPQRGFVPTQPIPER